MFSGNRPPKKPVRRKTTVPIADDSEGKLTVSKSSNVLTVPERNQELEAPDGETFSSDDVNMLIDLFMRWVAKRNEIQDFLRELAMALHYHTDYEYKPGQPLTHRVKGSSRTAKLIYDGPEWDVAELKRIYRDNPELASKWLRVKELTVDHREYQHLLTLSEPGNEPLERLKQRLLNARSIPQRRPKIQIESNDSKASDGEPIDLRFSDD